MSENAKELIYRKAQEIGVELNNLIVDKIYLYYKLLIEWNQKFNLTAITAYEEVVTKHFVDSLVLGGLSVFRPGQTLIDVGTGAGFPGLPLAIVYPELQVTLLDSLNKRVRFLEEVTTRLQLPNVRAIHGRAEENARQPAYREQYDWAVSRAVAELSVLAEYCLPYVKVGGIFVAYKSGTVDAELKQAEGALALLGGEVGEIERFQLPGSDIQRTLVLVNKQKHTAPKYPRKSPAKKPLH